jgi:hypothetical protein
MMQKGMVRRLKGNDAYNLRLKYLISSEWCAGTLGGDETLCAEPVRGTLFFCVSSSFFSLSETTFGCAYAHESTYETAMMDEKKCIHYILSLVR